MHVQSVQNYCFSLSNMQICDVLVAVVVVVALPNIFETTLDFPESYYPFILLFFSEHDQDRDTKKEKALHTTFSQSDWFIPQNKRF